MKQIDANYSDELSGYLAGATMMVLLALAAECLSAGQSLTAIVLAVVAIGCFYVGASRLVDDLEREDDTAASR
jgi:hypothetical protein